MPDDEEAVVAAPDPMEQVLRHRREEALEAGMSWKDADKWAIGLEDVQKLRHLIELHCPPSLLGPVLNGRS